jgi:hypothetical protein
MSNKSADVVEVSDQQVSNKVALTIARIKEFTKFATKFCKRHKLALAIAAAVILIIFAIFNAMPSADFGDTKLINLNTPVKISKGQTAKLKYDDVSVYVVNFLNEKCPEGKTCFGPGQFADYTLSINGKKYPANSMSDKNIGEYTLHTVSSDYKTYAEVELTKLK